ncbi:hypothetical protein F959_00940 [Acinetobacter venetianus RAG-1 = CIP 110063]|uniref:Uncharacterized protein n=1 Tax=Acinetobacter venetianus (strain ATCC 31012 / DSM 23050 / BCRC 14357 / CCUG 45561 / CIP 110063 / KCTC 2702 / LMG 19082 / RAG-1) TaxID=1191460 RepID=N8YNB9_ACIVR|nr:MULTISPECIES: hypothetical protein [Acinetobacter]ENV38176.1 hypothetical protein F959_00940 [Acinetobacter venetianus RAG-1 = CIP 110063]MBK5979377.1 hypothetical protein [Acinetobacter baumannii]
MRELSIFEYSVISGGMTESQCVGAATIVGGVVGGIATRNPAGVGVGATIGNIVGGIICAPITNNQSSEDGDE